MIIPKEHWEHVRISNPGDYILIWEKSLLKSIELEPNPAERFAAWLTSRTTGTSQKSPRLMFVEQPYLAWAELVDKVVEFEKESHMQYIISKIQSDGDD